MAHDMRTCICFDMRNSELAVGLRYSLLVLGNQRYCRWRVPFCRSNKTLGRADFVLSRHFHATVLCAILPCCRFLQERLPALVPLVGSFFKAIHSIIRVNRFFLCILHRYYCVFIYNLIDRLIVIKLQAALCTYQPRRHRLRYTALFSGELDDIDTTYNKTLHNYLFYMLLCNISDGYERL